MMTGQFRPSLWRCLRHPRETLRAFEKTSPSSANVPYRTWAWLTFIAVAGSCLYGASLALALPRVNPVKGAFWLALSAGLAWCVFGPALVLLTRRNLFTLAHACLVTMAYGEAVLMAGALINLWLGFASALPGNAGGDPTAPAINIACIALSNLVMAASLARQLQVLGVPVGKTLLAWIVILNGSGALFFWLFGRLLALSP